MPPRPFQLKFGNSLNCWFKNFQSEHEGFSVSGSQQHIPLRNADQRIMSQASFPILTNDAPELGVISPLRGGRKRCSVLFQDSVLVPSSRDLQLNSPR